MKRVLVIGGGFGGLYACNELCKILDGRRDVKVTLVNETNYFLFTPLLHEIATGSLSKRSILLPIREMLKDDKFSFVKGRANHLDLRKKVATVKLASGEIEIKYDYVVVAVGSTTSFFGTPGAEENSFTLKSVEDAERLRNHIIEMFENNTRDGRDGRTRFVVVGGGPTGIETVAEMCDLVYNNIVPIYKVSEKDVDIVLVHSSKNLLNGFSEKLDPIARRRLSKLKVRIMTGSKVTRVGRDFIEVNGKKRVRTQTVIWTAGVTSNVLETEPKLKRDGRMKILVGPTLQVPGHREAFAIGDCSSMEGAPIPATGQVSIQQAATAARNIAALASGKPAGKFRYDHKGSMMSMGPKYAAAHIGDIVVHGWWVWFLWRTIYLSKMMGTRNKAKIAMDWLVDILFKRDTAQV